HDIELSVWKGQRLGERVFKNNLDAGLSSLLGRPGDHLGRCIQSVNRARRTDISFSGNRKSTCAATYIQNRLARFKVRQTKHLLSKGRLVAERYQPDEKIVANGRVQEQAGLAGCFIPLRDRRHIILLVRSLAWRRFSLNATRCEGMNNSLKMDICSLCSVGYKSALGE